MKRLLILFLFLGAVFAAQFPQQISGGLQLTNSSGDTTNGEAYYATSDQVITVWVEATPMSSSEWSEYSYYYDQYGWSSTTSNGITYYYYCEEYSYDYSTAENICYIDAYSGGTYYMIDSSIVGGSSSEALNTGTTVGNQIIEGEALGGLCPCPIALGFVVIAIAGIALAREQ